MKPITLKVDEDITMTFKELVMKVAEMHKWNPLRVDEKEGLLYYCENGGFYQMDKEGFCYECDKEGNYLGAPYTEMVDLEDEMECPRIIWATDLNNNLMAIMG